MHITTIDAVHQGQIVAKYRKAKNWSQCDLAEALRVDMRTVQRMEKQPMIKSLERRKLLVGLLGIPFMLIGLSNEQKRTIQSPLVLNHDRMTFFEDEMVARWNLYHTGGTIHASHGLDSWIREIDEFARTSWGTGWHERALTLLVMSYQLRICTSRDMLDFTQAQDAAQQAAQIAKELDNPELIAATHAHAGITLLQQDNPVEAIEHLRGALTAIYYIGLPGLKSYILQALSEAYAKNQQARECWQSIELAERTLAQRQCTQEPGRTHLYASSITAQKGINAVLLHDNQRALSLIDKSLTSYNPTFVRGRARLLAQQAEAYFGLGEIDASVTVAEEALTLSHSVGSRKTILRVQTLHTTLVQSRWRKERSIARLGALLSL